MESEMEYRLRIVQLEALLVTAVALMSRSYISDGHRSRKFFDFVSKVNESLSTQRKAA